MTNLEFYLDDIRKYSLNDVAFDVKKNKIIKCSAIECTNCKFTNCDNSLNVGCLKNLAKWLLSEYEPPKPKPTISKAERKLLELLETGYLVRTQYDRLYYTQTKPIKKCNYWESESECYSVNQIYNKEFHFDFIVWDDEEPWSVEDLLKLEVRE